MSVLQRLSGTRSVSAARTDGHIAALLESEAAIYINTWNDMFLSLVIVIYFH